MPIEYRIDHERRIVFVKGRGILTDEDIFGYQREVWSRSDVGGYNELMDMGEVDHVALPSGKRVHDLALLSASMDKKSIGSKFAIVARSKEAFGLGRMYQMYREMETQGAKEVGVFHTMDDALAFLGIEDGPPDSSEMK
jgi:hypothetical protein